MNIDAALEDRFESWAIVEVFGFGKYAGFVTEAKIGSCSFVQIKVPEVPGDDSRGIDYLPGYTKLLGEKSIFAVTPCSEEVAREAAQQFRSRPLTIVEMPTGVRQLVAHGEGIDEPDDDRDYVQDDDYPL